MMRAIRTILAVFVIVIGVGKFDEARADPMAVSSFDDSEWRVDFSPYVFLPYSVEGDSTIAGQTVSFDLDTSDILDLLSFALSGLQGDRRGRRELQLFAADRPGHLHPDLV